MEVNFENSNFSGTDDDSVPTAWQTELQPTSLPAKNDAIQSQSEHSADGALPGFQIKLEDPEAAQEREMRLNYAWSRMAGGDFDWRDSKTVIEDYREELANNKKGANREMNLRFQLSAVLYMTGKTLSSPTMMDEGKAELESLAKDYPKFAKMSPEFRGLQTQMNREGDFDLVGLRSEGFFEAAKDRLNIGGTLTPSDADKEAAQKFLIEAYNADEKATNNCLSRLWPGLSTAERRTFGDCFAAAVLESRKQKAKRK